MRLRTLLLAVLAGIALALFGSVQPAAADGDVDCTKVFVLDPSVCDEPA